ACDRQDVVVHSPGSSPGSRSYGRSEGGSEPRDRGEIADHVRANGGHAGSRRGWGRESDHGGRPTVGRKQRQSDEAPAQSARTLYETSNEELMDNAKQFTSYPVAILKSMDTFANGTITVKFKTIAGDADRASGILFNVKPNGDRLAIQQATSRTTW